MRLLVSVWLCISCIVFSQLVSGNTKQGESVAGIASRSVDHAETVSRKGVIASSRLSVTEVFTREFLTIQYQVNTNDPFITLAIEEQKIPGAEMIPLRVNKQKAVPGEKYKYRYTFNVKYYSTRAGKQSLGIPTLFYSEGGKVKHRFGFKARSINIKDLPPYLPPYIPTGNIELDHEFPQSGSWLGWYEKDKVYYWNIFLRASDITPDALPEIRQQLRSNKRIRFLPAEITRQTIIETNLLSQQIHYSIPFVLKTNGRIELPELRLQSFDSNNRRLMNRQYRFEPVTALHIYLQIVVIVLLVIVAAYIVWRVLPALKELVVRVLCLQRARKLIGSAGSVLQMRIAMQEMSRAFNWPENQTLEKWVSYWREDLGENKEFAGVLQILNRGLYSASNTMQDELVQVKKLLHQPVIRQYKVCLQQAIRKIS